MSLLYCCCRCVTGKAFTCRARYAMDQGWIRLTPNPFSPLYDDVSMREAADEGEEVYLGELSQIRRKEVNFRQFVQLFQMIPLPRDNEHKEQFDSGVNFLLRDPILLRTQDVPGYRTKDRFGSPQQLCYLARKVRLVLLGSHRVEHPGAAPFPPQRTQETYVQCGLRRFPHEGFRWCWFREPPWNIDLCGWSEDDYSGHYWLEKKY